MINQSAFELAAVQLSTVECPDCGRQHEVSVEAFESGVVSFSAPSAYNCPGFNRMVNDRLRTCNNLDPKAELLLRRFLGDPLL